MKNVVFCNKVGPKQSETQPNEYSEAWWPGG